MTRDAAVALDSGATKGSGDGWRALGLMLLAASGPFEAIALVSAPFLLLALLCRPRTLATLLIAGVVLFVEGMLARRGFSAMWQLERGWSILVAGGFVAATLRFTRVRFFDRALLAVALATAIGGVVFAFSAADWGVVEEIVRARVEESVAVWTEMLSGGMTDPAMREALQDGLARGAQLQVQLIPATLALTSVFALGTVWWAWRRLAEGARRSLGSLGAFRFREELIWFLILGLALSLPVFEGRTAWVGLNLLVFMGVLYAARGLGVVLSAFAGGSWGPKVLLIALALLFPPGAAFTFVLVGIGDNWIDFRSRIAGAGEK